VASEPSWHWRLLTSETRMESCPTSCRLGSRTRVGTRQRRGIKRVADQLGVGVESLRNFVKQAEIDDGVKPGVTTAEAEWIRQLADVPSLEGCQARSLRRPSHRSRRARRSGSGMRLIARGRSRSDEPLAEPRGVSMVLAVLSRRSCSRLGCRPSDTEFNPHDGRETAGHGGGAVVGVQDGGGPLAPVSPAL
jgi:hypothetical protein